MRDKESRIISDSGPENIERLEKRLKPIPHIKVAGSERLIDSKEYSKYQQNRSSSK